jgi:iron complex outermembrane receptor protein
MRRTTHHPAVRNSTLALAVAAALFAGVAAAQDEPKEEGEDGTAQLDVVTVTAQRRVEDVNEVPIAITTLADEKLDVIGSGGDDIRVLGARLPSLNVESSFGRAFPRFYIRGLGNTDFDLNASQPVSLIYDDIVQENPLLKGFPLFDLDSIEMARGPQGTLFGRNTPAGVLKFQSRRPSQEQEGYAQVSYGQLGNANFEGAWGGGLNDVWSMRASALYQRRDDWVDNTRESGGDDLEGYREFAARVQLLYAPSDDREALFNVHLRSLDGTARLFRANIIQAGSNDFVPGFDADSISIDGGNEQELDSFGANARLRFDFGRVTLFSVTGYESADSFSRGDIDGGFGAAFAPPFGPGFIPFPAESADGLPEHRQLSQEFRFESNDWGDFDWQAGVFWFDESISIDSFSYDTLAGGVQNGYARQEQDNTAWALFASGEFQASDALTLRAGVRYTRDEKDFLAFRTQSPFGAPDTGILRADPSDSDVSLDVSAVWAIADEVNLYGRVARGFRAPSIQGRIVFGDTISVADSETSLSYEIGVKADLFDRRARVGFAIFDYTVDDLQLTAVGGAANFNTLINAEEANGEGAEVDFEALITDRFMVTLGASYNNTTINSPGLAIEPCGSGCTVLDPAGPIVDTVLIDGNRLPQSPETVLNMTARYGIPMGEGAELFFFTDWAYRDEVNFFLYESEEFRGDSLVEGGLRIGYNWDYGNREVALFGRNITDEQELVGGIDFNNLTGFINEPRLWGVEFTARF